jgi:hypothetical protein
VIPVAVVAALALVVALVVVLSGDDSTSEAGSGEIFLQPISELGPDPFGPSAANKPPGSTIPSNTPVTLGGGKTAPTFPKSSGTPGSSGGPITVNAMSGGTPGLYGGTENQSTCDKQQMIDFLEENADKAKAWADAQGIDVNDLSRYIDALTGVFLRSDTRVTNHGFKNGKATPLQSVLQEGTAVLVDQFGTPRTRCACGNPLLPPKAVSSTPTYNGNPWPGFTPTNVTVINASTTVINVIVIIDVGTGIPLGRQTGPDPGRDLPLPGGSTTTTSTSTTSTTTSTTQPSGTFVLVDVKLDPSPAPAGWTVDTQAGTATQSGPGFQEDYRWTYPTQLDPAGSPITWGGTPTGNANVEIQPFGEGGLTFDTTDLEVSSKVPADKSAKVLAPASASQVKLKFAAGFSISVTYTYER